MLLSELLAKYWAYEKIVINLMVLANIAGALLLGLLLGYERFYNGRAAGMRTFGLVCMSSCALVALAGAPDSWYPGVSHVVDPSQLIADPTRIIQGILTGIGFLCAGVIMKDGFNISGLTTSAALWSSSTVGILVGIGFYATAILLTFLSAALMMWMSKIENWLPSRQALAICLRFHSGFSPEESVLRKIAQDRGYEILTGSLHISSNEDCQEWRYLAVAPNKNKCATLSELAKELSVFNGVLSFDVSYSRN